VFGGIVTMRPNKHELFLDYDQTSATDVGAIQIFHSVRFEGVDVFGHSVTASKLIATPPMLTRAKRIKQYDPGAFIRPMPPFVDPIPDRLIAAELTLYARELIASGHVSHSLQPLVQTVVSALTNGAATLNAETAAVVLGLIGEQGLG
jgi:hypothetical protein